MHAATLRRLIVFGVCAVGVSCLYLAPSLARTPHQVSGPRPHDEPSAQPTSSPPRDTSRTAAPRPEPAADRAAHPSSTTLDQVEDAGDRRPAEADPTSTGATAFDPAAQPDDESPAPVTDLTSAAVSPSRLTLSWPAASDNVGVVGYKVVLDGFEVATTVETHATVRWFNDDAREHLVQVRALDAAGNESPSSPNLLVARPTPQPTPSAEPSSPAPEPPPAPQPTRDPVPSPSTAPSADTGTDVEPHGAASLTEPTEPGTSASAEAR